MTPGRLPDEAVRLCEVLAAPPRLVAHLTLVHDVTRDLLDALEKEFPMLDVDREAALFGAATHDLGKVLHPSELTGPGHLHEDDGPSLLERYGVPQRIARFARTHARWRGEALEDVLVALADNVWKGKRVEALETRAAEMIAGQVGREPWDVFASVDSIYEAVAEAAPERLSWQLNAGR